MLIISKHTKLRALLSSYLDGEVSEAEARDLERHLETCASCRSELEGLRATVGLLRQLPQLAVPRSFRLRETPDSTRAGPSWAWPTRLAASMAALLLIALLAGDAIGLFTQAGGASQEPTAAVQFQGQTTVPAQEMMQDSEVQALARAKSGAAVPPTVAPAPQAATPVPQPQPAATLTPAPMPFMAAAAPAAPSEGSPPPEGMPGNEGYSVQATPAPDDTPPENQPMVAAAMQPPSPVPEATSESTTAPPADMSALYTRSASEEATPVAAGPVQGAVTQDVGPESGIRLPLWQMEAATGALVVVLLAVTVWSARRPGRQPRA